MDILGTTRAANAGSRSSEEQRKHTTAKTALSQREKILAHLLAHHSLTTLELRNDLFIMSCAARIKELKERGHNIVTTMIPVEHGCKRRIARYTLLTGAPHVEN